MDSLTQLLCKDEWMIDGLFGDNGFDGFDGDAGFDGFDGLNGFDGDTKSMEIHEKRKIAVVVRDWCSFGVGKVGNEMKFGTNCCVGVVNASESVSMIRYLKLKKMP